jgi:uncharacterized RDD family membrane protein YckC
VSQPSPWDRAARPRDGVGASDPFRRIGARIVDAIVLTPFVAVLAPLGHRHHHTRLAAVAIFAIGAVYEIVAVGRFGRTVGKAATHIRVVAADGAPVTWLQSLVRWAALLGVATLLGTLVAYLGVVYGLVVTACVLARGLGPHDHAARTKVITNVPRPPSPANGTTTKERTAP